MLAKLKTFALVGIDALPVEVEVDASAGLPKTILVGLPETAVKESIHRIERALANLGYQRPSGRTVINLAPADLPKNAGSFDLPIALGLLVATGQLLPEQVDGYVLAGELALDGNVRPVKGVLSIAMAAAAQGLARLLVPHANAREAAVVEQLEVHGGNPPAPGEISLAHHGVLFLDELPEFHRKSLEVLRQPLEEGRVTIARALASATFPASFVLVAAMNPCPCGYLGDARRVCKCGPLQIERYMGRVSGPLLDRIDLHIEVPAVPFQELSAVTDGTSSASMREQVLHARQIQQDRFGVGGRKLNAHMGSRQLRKFCPVDSEGKGLLRTAMESLGLSARAHDRILRMA